MGALMEDAIGIGLAATQLGMLRRLLVYRVEPDSPVMALVNPVIEWSGKDEEILDEGCLSLRASSWRSSARCTCASAPRTSSATS